MVLIIGVRQDLMLILNFNWPNWKRNIKPIYPQIWGLTCGFSIRGRFINRGKGLVVYNYWIIYTYVAQYGNFGPPPNMIPFDNLSPSVDLRSISTTARSHRCVWEHSAKDVAVSSTRHLSHARWARWRQSRLEQHHAGMHNSNGWRRGGRGLLVWSGNYSKSTSGLIQSYNIHHSNHTRGICCLSAYRDKPLWDHLGVWWGAESAAIRRDFNHWRQ